MLGLLCLVPGVVQTVAAEDQLHVDFSYPAGGVNRNPGWLNVNPNNQAQVEPADLRYEQGEIALDNADSGMALRLQADTPLDNAAQLRIPPKTDSFYFSCLAKAGADESAGADVFTQIWFWDGHFGKTPIPGIVHYRSGSLAARIGDKTVPAGASTADGETRLVVAHVEKADGSPTFNRITIYVDPHTKSSESGAAATVDLDTGKEELNRIGIRTAFRPDAAVTSNLHLGEFRVGDTWESVVTP